MNDKWVRRRYAVLYSPSREKGVVMDTFAKRLFIMRRRLSAWAQLVEERRSVGDARMVMIMLTYAKIDDYREGHIRLYMKDLKRRLGDKLLAFAWVAELQKRGAVHYHLILLVRKGTRIPLPDKSGMWSHGFSGIHTAKTPYYLLVYVGKEYQKDLSKYPKNCRLYAWGLRFGGKSLAERFGALSGLPVVNDGHSEGSSEVQDWQYVGACIDKDFAKILLPSDTEILK